GGTYGGRSCGCQQNEKIPVASSCEVKTGYAQIISTVDGEGTEKYDVEITRLYNPSGNENRCMSIKVTDSRLIEKTGGIVQGMSGSPIIQNGMLVGAVTHVFVNDPTQGYGIYAEKMLAYSELASLIPGSDAA
ncbi:MAG: SpoIVB peptidase, partial [Clostridia bacterium]|nr:SpoIVB peptidase [Clostridia bacterium]